jgi:hypothetical protein
MKTLQESLFDDDLVAKEIKRIPGTLGYDWEYDGAISYNRTVDIASVFKIFDKNYMKKHPPTAEELFYGIELWYDNFEKERQKKYNRMAKVMELWTVEDIIDLLPKYRWGVVDDIHAHINSYPGIKDDASATALFKFSSSERKLEITVANTTPVTREITFYFKRR